jgi:hypothetical protein
MPKAVAIRQIDIKYIKDEEIGVLLIEVKQIAKILAASILTLESSQ